MLYANKRIKQQGNQNNNKSLLLYKVNSEIKTSEQAIHALNFPDMITFMADIVFLNGDWVEKNEAKVSVFDRGFLFADGVYEVIPVVNSTTIDFKAFIERLSYSLDQLSLPSSISSLNSLGICLESQFSNLTKTLIKLDNIIEGGIYLQITRGVSPRDFAFPQNIEPTIMAFGFNKEIINSSLVTSGIKVITTEDIRWKRRDIKSIALLGQCMAKQKAVEQGAFETWMVEDGFVTEGSSSSAYIVKDNVIITRPLSNSILSGIRRKTILEMAKKNQLTVEQRLFTVDEALEADEAFISSATTFVLPVTTINNTRIKDGKVGTITQQVRDLYMQNALNNIQGHKEGN